jgi:hypothetical protein
MHGFLNYLFRSIDCLSPKQKFQLLGGLLKRFTLGALNLPELLSIRKANNRWRVLFL